MTPARWEARAWLDASAALAKALWALRAMAYGLDVRPYDDLQKDEKRQLIQQAQEILDQLAPARLRADYPTELQSLLSDLEQELKDFPWDANQ